MTTLRATIEPSLAAMVTDPGGAFWPGRVADWTAKFRNTGLNVTSTARVGILPARAVVYVVAPDNIMPQHLEELRREWSDFTWQVHVKALEIVNTIPAPSVDDADLSSGTLGGVLPAVGEKAGQLVTILADRKSVV